MSLPATLSFSDLDAKMPSKASSQLWLTAAGGFIKWHWISFNRV
jgi:hypothetical protein